MKIKCIVNQGFDEDKCHPLSIHYRPLPGDSEGGSGLLVTSWCKVAPSIASLDNSSCCWRRLLQIPSMNLQWQRYILSIDTRLWKKILKKVLKWESLRVQIGFEDS